METGGRKTADWENVVSCTSHFLWIFFNTSKVRNSDFSIIGLSENCFEIKDVSSSDVNFKIPPSGPTVKISKIWQSR